MEDSLEGLDGIAICADDVLIYGCGDSDQEAEADHDKKLRQVLERCRETNLKLNKEKFVFKRKSVKYLGHLITNRGLQADPDKVQAIKNM